VVYIQRTYTAHHSNSLQAVKTTSTRKKREGRGARRRYAVSKYVVINICMYVTITWTITELGEERSLVSSRQTYNQNKIARGMHLVSLNDKEASRNDGTYLRINVNQERNAVTS